MNKLFVSVMLIVTMLTTPFVNANASERYIERSFTFDGVAPTVIIHHPVYDWVLTVKGESLTWAKPNGSNAQKFTILPTAYSGYYAFREFNNGSYTQRYITYTPSGFKLAAPGTNKYGMEVVKDTQAYRFVWKASDKCAGKTVHNVWKFPGRNKICICVGGWGSCRIELTNA